MTINIKKMLHQLFLSTLVLSSYCASTAADAATIQNTASFSYSVTAGSAQQSITTQSNTVTLSGGLAPSPSVVSFYQYAPGAGNATPTVVSGGMCADTSGNYNPIPNPTNYNGQAINLSGAVPISKTNLYHAGEPIFIVMTDLNRNLDPTVKDTIDLIVTTSNGDQENLRLQETDINSGTFAGVIQSIGIPPAVKQFDCALSVSPETKLFVNYADKYYPTDTSNATALVDPYGRVFDSQSGKPLDGATITLIDLNTGLPAIVYCDDGKTICPSTVISGAPGNPTGGFRFPAVPPGNYKIIVTPPTGYTGPSVVSLNDLNKLLDPNGAPYTIDPNSSFELPFAVPVGPSVNFDVPLDPSKTSLQIQKTTNVTTASVGDFVQYQVIVTNNANVADNNVVLVDTLPLGFKYKNKSIRLNNTLTDEPTISPDGRTIKIILPSIPAKTTYNIHYVVVIGAGTSLGDATNTITGNADGGITANYARATLRVKQDLFNEQLTLVGRVIDGECNTPLEQTKGMKQIKLLLEDGTYVVTDKDGQYHFEGVRPGTHVVQVDLDSVPPEYEMLACIQNSRFAGRNFSQFVDEPGGGIWKADFYMHKKPPVAGDVGVKVLASANVTPDTQIAPLAYNFTSQFDTRSDHLSGVATQDLNNLITKLQGMDINHIEIIGHTDNVRIAPEHQNEFADNFALSKARAQTLANEIIKQTKVTENQILVGGLADTQPLVNNSTAENRAKNRRVQLLVYLNPPKTNIGGSGKFKINVLLDSHKTSINNLRALVQLPSDIAYVEGSASLNGTLIADPANTENLLRFELGSPGKNWNQSLSFEGKSTQSCNDKWTIKTSASFDTLDHKNNYSKPVEAQLACPSKVTIGSDYVGSHNATPSVVSAPATADSSGISNNAPVVASGVPAQIELASSKKEITTALGKAEVIDVGNAVLYAKPKFATDVEASGGKTEWAAIATPGVDFLFPAANYNPRSQSTRVVIKHEIGQTVVVKINGNKANPLNFDGTEQNPTHTVAISAWAGLAIVPGDNVIEAEILDKNNAHVATLTRTIHYSKDPVKFEFIKDQSRLVANGIDRPVIAVRLTDANGFPVRNGLSGPLNIAPPYESAQIIDLQQERQLAGIDRFKTTYKVEGDNGIAYVELVPTSQSGEVTLDLGINNEFGQKQYVRTWLESSNRNWVLVGFSEETLGYKTVQGNKEAYKEAGNKEDFYSDGATKFYAKGKILGKWLLTISYDSSKNKYDGQGSTSGSNYQRSLNGTIDPNQYYLLYGDGTNQHYDAASQSKLYLKLERDQFYAMFGDFDTNLTQTKLSKYSRTLTGVKTEYKSDNLSVTGFGADTSQSYARDEIRGNGTSGLYRLSGANLVINSEQITIETRDRFHSENILTSKFLIRYVDYDIDYIAGTIYFREPINGNDTSFNPVFIVAQYETDGLGKSNLNAGGRVAGTFFKNQLTIGATYVKDASDTAKNNLAGIDLKLATSKNSELRLEASNTSSKDYTGQSVSGNAYLAEWEAHSPFGDLLLYDRHQDVGFGVGQQNASETGTEKIGAVSRINVQKNVTVESEIFQQKEMADDATRDVLTSKLVVQNEKSSANVGLQYAKDQTPLYGNQESTQIVGGGTTKVLNDKVELLSQNEVSLGQNDNSGYPSRYLLQAGYRIVPSTKLIIAQEYDDGAYFHSNTTRVGAESTPWGGAVINSTLNQQSIGEYGERTFSTLGLTQGLVLNEHWGADANFDSSHSWKQSNGAQQYFQSQETLGVNNSSYGNATTGTNYSSGGFGSNSVSTPGSGGTNTGSINDYTAFSVGATYRAHLYSWATKLEHRISDADQRNTLTTGFIRQAESGVAIAGNLQYYQAKASVGGQYTTGDGSLSLAYRPLGSQWAVLDRFRLTYQIQDSSLELLGSQLNSTGYTDGSNQSRKIINNFALDHISRQWNYQDRKGNLFVLNQRAQFSVYYGSKYTLARIDGTNYSGYTDFLGSDVRFDVNRWVDVGFQGGILHDWTSQTFLYSFGPNVGFSPVENGWVTLGYNLTGFRDIDFDAAKYSSAGPYLKVRFKFDQQTKFGHSKDSAALDNSEYNEPPSTVVGKK